MLGLDETAAFFWSTDEGMPSRAARDYKSCRDDRRLCRRWWLEVIGNWGRSVVGERHGARSLTTRNPVELGSAIGAERIPISGHRMLILHLLQCGTLISKGCISSGVPL